VGTWDGALVGVCRWCIGAQVGFRRWYYGRDGDVAHPMSMWSLPGAGDEEGTVSVDIKFVLGEQGGAAVVAQLSDLQERPGVKMGKDVTQSCCPW
jgi:hypothetical protein